MRDRKILQLALHTCWALEPKVFQQLVRIVQRHAENGEPSASDMQTVRTAIGARAGMRAGSELQVVGQVAVVPVRGVISPHGDLVDAVSGPGSMSLDGLKALVGEAMEREDVRAVLLDIDSPGGAVDGVSEVAEFIRASRERKPIVAIANTAAMSAAYWIGSQATRFVATTGARVGAIGVSKHAIDETRALDAKGIDTRVVTSTELKNASLHQKHMTTAEVHAVADEVDAFHALFVRDIAAGRGIDESQASKLANGLVLLGQQAVEAGLVDEVVTFDGLLSDLNQGAQMKKPQTPTSGEAAGEKVGGRKKGGTRAEGDTVVNVQVPAAPEGAEEDEEEEDEEEGAEGEKPKEEAKSSTTAAVTKQPRLSAELLAEGARIERERVRAIRAMTRPGLEPTIEALCESGASPEDAARAIEVAAKSLTGKRLDDLRASAVEETITGAAPAPKAATARVPKEWAEEWRELSANFDGNVESFLAYKEAEKGGRLRAAGRGA